VYKFRDQTGQYKASSTGSSFSTAVTQGATSILIQILEESGWFIPIEREGLSNLLNERKIIRSSRAEFLNKEGDVDRESLRLPPLLFAGILIEGGVISYETNLLTGGVGLKYFGVGGSEEFRLDRVTIYLRAVSSQNGRILKTVHASKTILSQAMNAGLYRFVDYQRLLEAETGFSYNEPPEICLRQAMEKAVQALIIEGVMDNLWTLKVPGEMDGAIIAGYLEEKRNARAIDPAGLRTRTPSQFRLAVAVGGQEFRGDFLSDGYEYPYAAEIEYQPPDGTVALSLRASFCSRRLRGVLEDDILSIGAHLKYYMMRGHGMQPYVAAGLEFMSLSNVQTAPGIGEADAGLLQVPLRAGIRYHVFGNADLFLESVFLLGLDDRVDRIEAGRWNDYSMGLSMGIGVSFP
jgi:curli production assembly/transport component CsgG